MFHPPPGPDEDAPAREKLGGERLDQFVVELLDTGCSRIEVIEHLVALGFSTSESESILNDVQRRDHQARKSVEISVPAKTDIKSGGGKVYIWYGSLLLLFCFAFTAIDPRAACFAYALGPVAILSLFYGLSKSQ